ncbi:MAG: 16S rRNA processing protein RimM [Anaerolineae bacterium]|nr:16S rRNA processing protein RimM [Anaerolineae bacterium]
MNPAYLLLGEVLRPHGLRGELRIRLLTDDPERIAQLETVYLADNPEPSKATPYRVEGMRMNGDFGLLKLREIPDRTQAERYRGLYVLVDIEHAVPLEEDEFYLYQLLGLRVETDGGETLGTLVEVLETGANDVYVVDSPRYGEVLIPVIDETIVKTDIDAGVLIVRLPEGLLPNAGEDTPDEDRA